MKPLLSSWRAYAAAILLTALTYVFAELVLHPLLPGRQPLLVLLLAVSLAAAYGGLGPGLFSTALSVTLTAFTLEPVGVLDVSDVRDQIRLAVLASLGGVISLLFYGLQRSHRRELAVAAQLEAELQKLADVERSLTASRDQFELLAASVPEIVFVATADGHFEFLNSRWSEVTGLTREVALGAGWRVALHPEDAPIYDARLVEAVQQNRPLELRLRLRTREGLYRTFLLRASPSRRSDGALRWFGSATDIEDDERNVAALRASEERLAAAVDAAELGTFVWDPASDQVLWSERAQHVLGLPQAGVRTLLATLQSLHQESSAALHAALRAVVARGPGARFRHEIGPLDAGPSRHVLLTGLISAATRSSPTAPKCVGAVLDLSRERSAAVRAERLQQSLQLAVESTKLGIWDVDLLTASIVLSPRAREIFGLAADAPVNRDVLRACIVPEDLPSVEACWKAALDPRGQGRFDIDHRVLREDGSLLWLSSRGQAYFSGQGESRRAVRIAGTLLDITQRKEAEQQLAAQEERFRLATEAINGFIYAADLASGRVERTRGLYELLGWERSEVPPTLAWWFDQMHPDDLPRYQAQLQAAASSRNRALVTGYRVRHRDGHWRHLSDRAILVYDEHGVAKRMVGCRQDVSDQTEAMRALAEADERKDRFLAVLAHEMRNPMAPLRNAVSILRTAQFERPELLRSVEILDRQLGYTTRLVDDLLDIGRIGRGTLELRRSAVRLSEVVQSAVETVRPLIEERRQRLRVDLALDSAPVLIDPVRIAQVVANLLTNASKFSPAEGVIELSAATLGQHAQITVEDRGIGIPPAALATIFEMYAQLDRGEGEAHDGLGIGLALSRHLVELHGGQIRAYSDGRGTGARFVVSLPLQRAQSDVSQAGGAAPCRSLQVVVADDNIDSAESLAVLLTLDGHQVAVAHDGEVAVELTGELHPHVAILDLGMPKLDGYQAAAKIRAVGADRKLSHL